MPNPHHYRYDPRPADKQPIDREAWLERALEATAVLREKRKKSCRKAHK